MRKIEIKTNKTIEDKLNKCYFIIQEILGVDNDVINSISIEGSGSVQVHLKRSKSVNWIFESFKQRGGTVDTCVISDFW